MPALLSSDRFHDIMHRKINYNYGHINEHFLDMLIYLKRAVNPSFIRGWCGPHSLGFSQGHVFMVVTFNEEESGTSEDVLEFVGLVGCIYNQHTHRLSKGLHGKRVAFIYPKKWQQFLHKVHQKLNLTF